MKLEDYYSRRGCFPEWNILQIYALSTRIRIFLVLEFFSSEKSPKEKREGPFPSLPNPLCHNRFFGIRDFPYLKLRIRDFKAKSGRDSGLKVCAGGAMPKITLWFTGLQEAFGRDYGIAEPYWGALSYVQKMLY